jgi:hypothetical protein
VSNRIERARYVLEKACKNAFAFHDDIGTLIKSSHVKYLPDEWLDRIDYTAPYGKITDDPLCQDAGAVNATVLRNTFKRLLEAESQKRAAIKDESARLVRVSTKLPARRTSLP